MSTSPWWQSCVFYQIYVQSYADSNADGIGDLRGVIQHIPDLAWLGIGAIWLSPIYPSPMKDNGYDVSDYQAIDPKFGTMADFEDLVQHAHAHNIRVILDWVPNHTSDRHPWFITSRSSRQNEKRDWYIWRDQPNNWRADLGGGSAWSYDTHTQQYYLHSYLAEQPDLNWANPAVADAMIGTLRFWLDKGIDGFRADVINMIAKDSSFSDASPAQLQIDRARFQNQPEIHAELRRMHDTLSTYPQRPTIIGELWLDNQDAADQYYGHGTRSELDMRFHFQLSTAPWDANAWRQILTETANRFVHTGHWPSPVLGNHDMSRLASRYGSEAQARAAAVLLLTLPGTPFIYGGDELGLMDISDHDEQDVGKRDASRAPIPWDASDTHGWPTKHALPFPRNAQHANYADMAKDHNSILQLYRTLVHLHTSDPIFQDDAFEMMTSPSDNLLMYRRGRYIVAVNFSDTPALLVLNSPHNIVATSNASRTDTLFETTTLDSYEAAVLNPTVE